MKNIWMINHYATTMYFSKGGRHHWFAKELNNTKKYQTTIFCANTIHNSKDIVKINGEIFKNELLENVKYTFIKTILYYKSRFKRILNMMFFSIRVVLVMKKRIKNGEKPDYILASSVHPLSLLSGIHIGKKFKIPIIVEIRDLWPESIFAYTKMSRNSPFGRLMVFFEKIIYRKADAIIFTMEGGIDYIKEKKWHIHKIEKKSIKLSKIFHLNNCVALAEFNDNAKNEVIDEHLNDSSLFKIVYTGSIRSANNIKKLVLTAKEIFKYDKQIVFLIYGKGDQVSDFKKTIKNLSISNIFFKGSVDKKFIPYILSNSNLNIILYKQSPLKKYGPSLNKLFEYLAAGKPIITDCEFKYDIVKKYNAGYVFDNISSVQLSKEIMNIKIMSEKSYNEKCNNAHLASLDYDCKKLTNKLMRVFEYVDNNSLKEIS